MAPSKEDEGYFECTAINDVGEERRVIEVILQGSDFEFLNIKQERISDQMVDTLFFPVVPPSIEDDVTTVTAVKMSPVVLPCHVQGRPEPTVTWTKAGVKLAARGGSYRVLPTGKTWTSRELWPTGTVMPQYICDIILCLCTNVLYRCVGDNSCFAKSCWPIHLFSPQPSWSGSQTRLSHSARWAFRTA